MIKSGRKGITLLEAQGMGLDLCNLVGRQEGSTSLRRTTSNKSKNLRYFEYIKDVLPIEETIEETVEETIEEVNTSVNKEDHVKEIIDITPIDKPSDRIDIDDYILYSEYMIENGGTPSIEDYFKAIEYFKNRV